MPNSPYSKVFLITKQILFLEFDASSIDILIYFLFEINFVVFAAVDPWIKSDSFSLSVWISYTVLFDLDSDAGLLSDRSRNDNHLILSVLWSRGVLLSVAWYRDLNWEMLWYSSYNYFLIK